MKFHLQFPIAPFADKISHQDELFLSGSCFAENIGARLQKNKFRTCINPHGILYDPISIAQNLTACSSGKMMKADELFLHHGLWSSLAHHSRFSDPDKEKCLENIHESMVKAHASLKKAGWLILTFGSAYSYRHLASNNLAANCHKLPAKAFAKELCSEEMICERFNSVFEQIKKNNPGLKVLLTLSPVRYIRDGVVENNLSKAILLKAIHQLVQQHSFVHYFPAYELVIDDLRDYRFYKEDLVHPNELAQEYVWEKLGEACFDERTGGILKKIGELVRAAEHRALHVSSSEHQQFLAERIAACEKLMEQFPFIDLQKERSFFLAQLIEA